MTTALLAILATFLSAFADPDRQTRLGVIDSIRL
jgi:hypothetical protein